MLVVLADPARALAAYKALSAELNVKPYAQVLPMRNVCLNAGIWCSAVHHDEAAHAGQQSQSLRPSCRASAGKAPTESIRSGGKSLDRPCPWHTGHVQQGKTEFGC